MVQPNCVGGVQRAAPPFAQRENRAQQPAGAQEQSPGSKNTGWQSVRASHSARVVTLEHAPIVPSVPPPSPVPASQLIWKQPSLFPKNTILPFMQPYPE
jgi:hypothetical protein